MATEHTAVGTVEEQDLDHSKDAATSPGPKRSKPTWRTRPKRASWPIVLSIATLLVMVIVPLAFLTVMSFREGSPALMGDWTLENYRSAISSRTAIALRNTVVVSAVSTAISLIFAILLAWLVERTNLPFRNLAWSILLLPVAVPSILFVLSWTVLLSPNAGLLNVALRDWVPFLNGTSGPINIYGMGGVIFLDSMRGVTTIFLMLVASFRMFDPSMEEASRASGASTFATLKNVTLPAITPAIVGAGIYSFISSMDNFEAALAVGLPGGVFLLTTLIYFSVQLRMPIDWGLGAVYSVGFMIIMVLLVLLYRRIVRHTERFATVTGKGYRPARIDLGRWRWPAFSLVAIFGMITIVLPMLTMAWLSLRPMRAPIRLGTGEELSLATYQNLWDRGLFQDIAWNTVLMTVGTATLTMILCFVVSWVIVRSRGRLSGFVDGLTFLPYAFPGIAIAIAFVVIFLTPPLNSTAIYGSVVILVLALTTQYIAFGTRLMNGAVIAIEAELEEAGRVSGAKQMANMMLITMPLLLPAFIAGWVWVAANAARSFSVPVILAGGSNEVFASAIWNMWQRGFYPRAAAYGTVLVLVLLPFSILMRRLLTRVSHNG